MLIFEKARNRLLQICPQLYLNSQKCLQAVRRISGRPIGYFTGFARYVYRNRSSKAWIHRAQCRPPLLQCASTDLQQVDDRNGFKDERKTLYNYSRWGVDVVSRKYNWSLIESRNNHPCMSLSTNMDPKVLTVDAELMLRFVLHSKWPLRKRSIGTCFPSKTYSATLFDINFCALILEVYDYSSVSKPIRSSYATKEAWSPFWCGHAKLMQAAWQTAPK